MIDWPLALSTASQAVKFANDLRKIDKEVSQADLKLKIAELQHPRRPKDNPYRGQN
jgi:hypothetical protein